MRMQGCKACMEGCIQDGGDCQAVCMAPNTPCYVEPDTDPCATEYTACMGDANCEQLMTDLTAATTDDDRTPAAEACMRNNLCAPT